jgi:hypothetical protein
VEREAVQEMVLTAVIAEEKTARTSSTRWAKAPDGSRGFAPGHRSTEKHSEEELRSATTELRAEEQRMELAAATAEREQAATEEVEDDEDDLLFEDCVSLPAPDANTLAAIRCLRGMLRPEEIDNARADVLAAQQQLRASIVQAQEAQELELGLEQALGMETVATAELGDGGGTPAPKQGERLAESPPGDEPPSPAVRLRRFQLLEQHYSSGDTTVIERDRLKTHTHTSGVRPTSGTLL